MSTPNPESRRRFLKFAAAGAVAAPLLGTLLPRLVQAQDLPHLAESDPMATALGYRDDATKVDAAKYPQYKAGMDCSNCKFYSGKAGAAWGPCQIFPGKDVNAKGWCVSHAEKT